MKRVAFLEGCRPEPMSAYLKALAVLRLVSEQADPQAQGYWSGNVFRLDSDLDREALEQLIDNLNRTQQGPAALVSPEYPSADSRKGGITWG